MSGILFFIFASCHPLILPGVGLKVKSITCIDGQILPGVPGVKVNPLLALMVTKVLLY